MRRILVLSKCLVSSTLLECFFFFFKIFGDKHIFWCCGRFPSADGVESCISNKTTHFYWSYFPDHFSDVAEAQTGKSPEFSSWNSLVRKGRLVMLVISCGGAVSSVILKDKLSLFCIT